MEGIGLLVALKKAASLVRKGERIAIIPSHGGLGTRVAVRLEGLAVSWLTIEQIEMPGAVMEAGDVKAVLRAKALGFKINRTLNLPSSLQIDYPLGPAYVPTLPLMNPTEWVPPFPLTELIPSEINMEAVQQLLHCEARDDLRPELNCVCFGPSATYAGDESQFARAPTALGSSTLLLRCSSLQKWPEGPVSYFVTHDKVYFRIGAELRIIDRPNLSWWPIAEVGSILDATVMQVAIVPKKAFLEPFKIAKKIADRRMVVLGASVEEGLWLGLGTLKIPLNVQANIPFHSILDGNRLLDMLKSINGDTVTVLGTSFAFGRGPVYFSSTDFNGAIYPLIAT